MSVRRSYAPVLLLAGTLACASSRHAYHDDQMDFGSVRTVIVMPFTNLSRDQGGAERVRDVFSTMLLASGSVYVVPQGEVLRAVNKMTVAAPPTPSAEEVVKLGSALKADAVITGVLKEYGEVRSGASAANVISVSIRMQETSTGKVIWSASTTKGGVNMAIRLFGGGGAPLNHVTEEAVEALLDELFK